MTKVVKYIIPFVFESRSRMIGPICGHRLHKPKHHIVQFRENAINEQMRQDPRYQEYWNRRALLPDYYGEPGELCPGSANDRLVAGSIRGLPH